MMFETQKLENIICTKNEEITDLRARVKELGKETEVLKAAILDHHNRSIFSPHGLELESINSKLYSTILPGFSEDGTTLRDPPYPIKEVK